MPFHDTYEAEALSDAGPSVNNGHTYFLADFISWLLNCKFL